MDAFWDQAFAGGSPVLSWLSDGPVSPQQDQHDHTAAAAKQLASHKEATMTDVSTDGCPESISVKKLHHVASTAAQDATLQPLQRIDRSAILGPSRASQRSAQLSGPALSGGLRVKTCAPSNRYDAGHSFPRHAQLHKNRFATHPVH